MTYQRGDRIVLVLTSDPHTRLVPGTTGTVTSYDTRLGHLAVAWDDGSTLAMLLHDGDQVRPLLRPACGPKPCAAPTAATSSRSSRAPTAATPSSSAQQPPARSSPTSFPGPHGR